MADDFETMLVTALAPAERLPDRAFVTKVQAAVRLDKQLQTQRRMLAASLIKQLIAIAAVASALWWFVRAPAVASWSAESSAVVLAVLLAAFALLTGLVSGGNVRGWSHLSANRTISAS
jgi:membrane protein YdbS with pleckstrin-like domain